MSDPPPLTADRRQAALAKAADVRRQRAEVRHRLKLGALTLAELFEAANHDDEVIGRLKVLAAIESLPGVGKVKARRTMESIGIAESRRIRGLGRHQRAALLDAFVGRRVR
jgi:hypothetical protein